MFKKLGVYQINFARGILPSVDYCFRPIRDKPPRLDSQRTRYVSKYNGEPTSPASTAKDIAACNGKPTRWPSGLRSNYHFHPETEKIMNEQLGAELKASYSYLSMAGYFGRVDVALPGCETFFTHMHSEEHEHALRFFNYIKMRGGTVKLSSISAPIDQDWMCPLNAFKVALQLEMEVTDRLMEVNRVSEKHDDSNASDFIVTGFLTEQMQSVNELARMVSVLSGIGDCDLARFVFDQDLLARSKNS